jgi:hypothetical protein
MTGIYVLFASMRFNLKSRIAFPALSLNTKPRSALALSLATLLRSRSFVCLEFGSFTSFVSLAWRLPYILPLCKIRFESLLQRLSLRVSKV